MLKQLFFVPMLALGISTAALAQTDTVRVPDHKLLTQYLKPGMNQYLVAIQNAKSHKTLFMWYWLRDIKTNTRNNVPVFTISQHWYSTDTSAYRYVYSVNRQSDFAPLYHAETVLGKVNAYNWDEQKITGADTVQANTKKTFALAFKQPNLNWNLDIETFEMLPLAAGKVFTINFYDAGLDPPAYVVYKVTGSEMINYGDQSIDCWKLYTENNSPNGKYSETYWISKKNHQFLLEKDDYGNGLSRTKTKMPVNINLLEKFGQ